MRRSSPGDEPRTSRNESTGRFRSSADERSCPICRAPLATSAGLVAHVHQEHRESVRAESRRSSDDIYRRYSVDNEEWMRMNLDGEVLEAVSKRMEELDGRDQDVGGEEFDDGRSATRDVTAMVRDAGGSRTIFCTYVDHYASTKKDFGWGCGYRNIQMMISCLMKRADYGERLRKMWEGKFVEENAVPSIARLQALIEEAWREGFDEMGAKQLDKTLVNTRKWIGATEVATLFSSLRINCLLVDFFSATGPNSTHPELFRWAQKYFENASENGFVPPLFLQHQGHSRTVIGVEKESSHLVNLMILDPSWSKEKVSELEVADRTGLRLLRICPSELKAKQYQIVAVNGVMGTDEEYESSKVLKSVRIQNTK